MNAAKRPWLAGITLKAPTSPVLAQAAEQSLFFDVKSGVANPGVPVRRHVVVEPAAQVVSGQDDPTTLASRQRFSTTYRNSRTGRRRGTVHCLYGSLEYATGDQRRLPGEDGYGNG